MHSLHVIHVPIQKADSVGSFHSPLALTNLISLCAFGINTDYLSVAGFVQKLWLLKQKTKILFFPFVPVAI